MYLSADAEDLFRGGPVGQHRVLDVGQGERAGADGLLDGVSTVSLSYEARVDVVSGTSVRTRGALARNLRSARGLRRIPAYAGRRVPVGIAVTGGNGTSLRTRGAP